ncbi:NAD-dependent deacylase [Hyphococcus lacteus]|uniref:NAD-dependent deacylase n=1 Tax=Hyphococcus lacteus TaxID=3143536 RepID=UPI00387EA019
MTKKIVILTGSGVSAESGVATFRDQGGIWTQYDYRDVATPEGFASNPGLVHSFYNDRRSALPNVEPNAAHIALAKLEREVESSGGNVTIITQNVDDLHERGGSVNVLHMHGELSKSICTNCNAIRKCNVPMSIETMCSECSRSGSLRPYVVWFGEMPRFMDEAMDAILSADFFVSIGTSGSVYPAAGFVSHAHAVGVATMELNLEPSENAHLFSDTQYGPATEIVPDWVEAVVRQM